MRATIMRIASSGMLVAWLGAVAGVSAQEGIGNTPTVATRANRSQPPAVSPAGIKAPLSNRPDDERALRSLEEAYARSYNAGDARALAALFTDDAEMIDEHGERLRGRPSIESVFGSIFRQRPGATLSITPASLRFLGPDVAQEEGQTVVRVGDEPPSTRHYTVIFVKSGGRWLYSSVREEQEMGMSPHQHLEELAWLVGEWTDESPDSVVHTTCRWTEDGHFLLRDFTVRVQGKSVMTVNERIGWDPSIRQIKSWVFDSEGGHGTGLWSRAGNQWVIKSTGVLPDGRIATATHTLTRVGPQSARWVSVERTVGDRVVPDHAEYLMVRRAPQPMAR
jgi:uncharacterized protein (TIGR02246 family)